MSNCVFRKMLSLVCGGLFLMVSPASSAAVAFAHSYGCLAVLEQALLSHNLVGGDDMTARGKFTLNAVQAFGQHTVRVLDVTGADPNVFVHSEDEATPSLLNKVSERFAAIEFDRSRLEADSSGRLPQIFAFSVKDPRNIQLLLAGIQNKATYYRSRSSQIPLFDAVSNIARSILPVSGVALAGSVYYGGLELWQAVHLLALYFYEKNIFSLSAYHREANTDFEANMAKLKGTLDTKGQWAVWSSTAVVSSKFFDLTMQALKEGDHANRDEGFAGMATLARMAQESAYSRSDVGRHVTYVLADMVLDNSSAEVEMHVVLRFTRVKPRYPVKRKVLRKYLEADAVGAIQPIPVR